MFKKRTVDLTEDLLQGEHCVYNAICRLNSARSKASSNQLKWASGEANVLVLSLFQRLAELQWMYNKATKEMAEKHLELSKTLKKVFQEERHLEDSRKDLQATTAKIAKIQKQVECASRKGDHLKARSLEAELFTHTTLSEQLTASIETRANKLELNKLSQLKKALVCQAEGVITLSGHCQQLYASQMQLIDLLPDTSLEAPDQILEVDASMSSVVSKVSQLLNMHSPPCGGIDLKSLTSDQRQQPPKSPRPEVDYTQGMYCEIVIPEPGARRSPPTVHRPPVKSPPQACKGGVPMRRCQSGSTPVLERKAQADKHRSAVIMDKQESMPIRSSYDLNSSSEALDTIDDPIDKGYSKIAIVPFSKSPTPSARSMSTSPEVDNNNGYAKPADVVPFRALNFKDQQRGAKQRVPSSPEGKSVSPYETIDIIQKRKQEQKKETTKPKDEKSPDYEPIYSAPFDSVTSNSPLKVSQECTKDQLSVAPHKSNANGKAYPNEKSFKSIYNIQPTVERASTISSPIARGTKERSSKKFKVMQSSPNMLPSTQTSETKPHYIVELEKRMEKQDSESELSLEKTTGSSKQKPLPVAETVSKLRTGHASVMKPPLAASKNK